MNKRVITEDELLAWTGSDNTKEELIGVVLGVLNDGYCVDNLRQDILDYFDEEEEDE